MVEMVLGVEQSALDGLPAFYGSLFPFLPLRVSRAYDNARFNVESECGLVVESDSDSEALSCAGYLHEANDFVSDFGEIQFSGCTLDASHLASYTGDMVRAASLLNQWC